MCPAQNHCHTQIAQRDRQTMPGDFSLPLNAQAGVYKRYFWCQKYNKLIFEWLGKFLRKF